MNARVETLTQGIWSAIRGETGTAEEISFIVRGFLGLTPDPESHWQRTSFNECRRREADYLYMKPYIICHMIMSLDGRIVSSRWQLSPQGRAEYETTGAIHAADAWMCGRVTMAGFARGARPAFESDTPPIPKIDYIAPHQQTSYAVALDPGGKLYWDRSDLSGDHIITVLTEVVSADYLAYLRDHRISYLFGGRDRIDLPAVLDKLGSEFQIKTLLLEGGGKINGSMLCAGAIDELSILLAPVVDGLSGSPALFDTLDASIPDVAGVRWKLSSMERRADDIIWVRYVRGNEDRGDQTD